MARRVGKQNPELRRIVVALRRAARTEKSGLWASVADRLERARHQTTPLNVGHLERLAAAGETIVVPGKVLAKGRLTKAVTVGAFAFSEEARDKIRAVGGTPVTLDTLLKTKPNGAGVRLLA